MLRLFVNRPAPRGFACVCAAALLSGCVGNPFLTSAVDPASPVAADVATMARAGTDYPTFAEIPPLPANARPLREYGRAADQLELASAKLQRETAPGTWTLTGTQAFVNRAQTIVGPAGDDDASATEASEAFARQIRERATPPPLPR
ncbi:hypothetical protein [Phenylobacterium sp.]|uniref:hypothetical protein n=1 Tax=Phenylobacterium sp. TaxID=1871053 RepID=UPI002734A582|nr:hypothetical protein [Phenylobacterium sp.]MDP3852673.1 hypothetical protein [Phenylobacterium sp.]